MPILASILRRIARWIDDPVVIDNQVSVYIDGKKIAESVTHHQARRQSRAGRA